MASPLLGRVLSHRFRVAGFIGEGAMANVYRGEDLKPPTPDAREVAIKVMHAHLTLDPTFVSRFRREAKAAMHLKHPNTVKVIEYGVDKEVLYIAMELLGGQDLFESLVVERRLSEQKAAKIMIQICDALIAAHAEGIVHRDLKPENIMLLPNPANPAEPRVKVLDFGIAKILEKDENSPDSAPNSLAASALTIAGVVVGTPAYMSPEQCRGDTIDARSDLYSCGVLLYQLLTGRMPFAGGTPIEIAMQQLRDPPPAPSQLVPGLHPALEATILTALAKWPAQRQQSAADFKRELEQVLGELPTELHPPSGRILGAEPISSHEMRRASSGGLPTLASPAAARLPSRPDELTSPSALEPSSAPVAKRGEQLPPPAPAVAIVSAAAAVVPAPSPSSATAAAEIEDPEGDQKELTPTSTLASAAGARKPARTVKQLASSTLASAGAPSAVAGRPWVLVPIAIFLGIVMGTFAFLLSR